jgi:hypothetical protein
MEIDSSLPIAARQFCLGQLLAKSVMLRIFPHIDNRKISQRVSLLLALSLQVFKTR